MISGVDKFDTSTKSDPNQSKKNQLGSNYWVRLDKNSLKIIKIKSGSRFNFLQFDYFMTQLDSPQFHLNFCVLFWYSFIILTLEPTHVDLYPFNSLLLALPLTQARNFMSDNRETPPLLASYCVLLEEVCICMKHVCVKVFAICMTPSMNKTC